MLVVYVSPFLRKDVYLFLDRLARIEGIRVGLISTLDELPPQVLASLSGHCRVTDLLDPMELVWAATELSRYLDAIVGPAEAAPGR